MKRFYSALVIGCLIFGVSTAQEHSDVEVAIEDGAVEVHERVAEGEFGSELNDANTTDDPGFAPEGAEDTPATTTFVGGQQLAFETINLGNSGLNFWYWDGTGTPSFGASPHDLNIRREVAGTVIGSIDLSDGNGGFTMFAANADGFFDEHLDFTLDATTPDEGVYVFGLTLSSPNATPAVDPSEPVFFVMASQGLDEDIHEAAVDYVAANLVPEPSAGISALIAAGLVIAGIRRRR